jgi:hypothetical protein
MVDYAVNVVQIIVYAFVVMVPVIGVNPTGAGLNVRQVAQHFFGNVNPAY